MTHLREHPFSVDALTRPPLRVEPNEAHLQRVGRPDLHTPELAYRDREANTTALTTLRALFPLTGPQPCEPYRRRVALLGRKSRSELETAFRALAHQPFNYDWLKEVGCFLNSIVQSEKAKRTAPSETPYLDAGLNGVVARGAFPHPYAPLLFPPDRPPAFILKTNKNPKPWKDDTLNELIVGLYALNALRKEIPSFMYVYGGYECGVAQSDDDQLTLCTPSPDRTTYSMIETVFPAETMNAFVYHASWPAIVGIVAQVLLALALAKRRCDFAHNDLHLGNVMIRRLDRPVTLAFPVEAGRTYYITTTYIATLIDFGMAHVTFPLDEGDSRLGALPPTLTQDDQGRLWAHTGRTWTAYGKTPLYGNSLADINTFLIALYLDGPKRFRKNVNRLIAPLYDGRFEAFVNEDFEWPPIPPFGLDIDPLDMLAPIERDVPGLVRTHWDESTDAPLFSCTSGVCVRSLAEVSM